MEKQDKPIEEYSLDDLLKEIGIDSFSDSHEEIEAEEKLDEISILRKKMRRLEKENTYLLDKISEAEEHALLALKQNYYLREEVKAAFAEMAKREERTIEKNTLPFEGERRKPRSLDFVNSNAINHLKKENKISKFSYAMGTERNVWNIN